MPCGDFNAPPDSDEIRALTGRSRTFVPRQAFLDAWEVAGDGPGHSWTVENPYAALDLEPSRRIDYVFVGYPRRGGAATPWQLAWPASTRSTASCPATVWP